jgi:hypothetical protein
MKIKKKLITKKTKKQYTLCIYDVLPRNLQGFKDPFRFIVNINIKLE